MSNAQQHSAHGAHGADDSHEVHEGPIKTPKQLIAAVIASFVIPIIVIIMLANYVSADKRPAAGTVIDDEQAVARRLQPVGKVEVRDASDTAALKSGQQVYTAQCAACHAAGVAGAPKTRRRRCLGRAHQDGLRVAAEFVAEGQRCHGCTRRRRP